MRQFVLGAALSAVVLGVGFAVAGPGQVDPKTAMVSSMSPDLLRDALKPLNLEWEEAEDGDGLIAFQAMNGDTVRFVVYQYQGTGGGPVESIGISGGYNLAIRLDPVQMNRWNSTTRFCKAYVDSDGDPFLTADLDIRPGVSLNAVTEFVRRFQASQAEFEQKVLNRRPQE